jgi:hypothetical protein
MIEYAEKLAEKLSEKKLDEYKKQREHEHAKQKKQLKIVLGEHKKLAEKKLDEHKKQCENELAKMGQYLKEVRKDLKEVVNLVRRIRRLRSPTTVIDASSSEDSPTSGDEEDLEEEDLVEFAAETSVEENILVVPRAIRSVASPDSEGSH